MDGCVQGYCQIPFCNSLGDNNQLCTNTAGSDGTCVTVDRDGQAYINCVRGGSATQSCNPTLVFYGQSASQLCAPGTFCGAEGSCDPVCDPTAPTNGCSAGYSCVSDNDILPLAVAFGPYDPTSGLCQPTTPPPFEDAGSLAPHQPFPTMPPSPGPLLATPKLVTISFAGTEAEYQVKEYGDWIVGSEWLAEVGAGYGVGSATHLADVELPYALDAGLVILDTDVQSFVFGLIADGGIPVAGGPAALLQDPDVLFMVFYPSDVTVEFGPADVSCSNFLGYHSAFTRGRNSLVYAVINDCSYAGQPLDQAKLEIQLTASHELMEASTDPQLTLSNPTYFFSDYSEPWAYDLAEVADVCDGAANLSYDDGGYAAQEIWSLSQAAAGNGSPCGPAPTPGAPYFTVSPVAQGGTNGLATVSASSVAQTATFTLTGWSSAPTSPWYVYPSVVAPSVGSPTWMPEVTISTPATGPLSYPGSFVSMNNGETATLTVGIPPQTPSTSVVVIELDSTQDPTYAVYNEWPVAVLVQ